MKKYVLVMMMAAMVYAFSSCTKIDGSGPTVTKNYSITGFTAVDNGIDANVFVTQGNDFKVEIQAQQNILDQIQTPVVNGELQLRFHDQTITWGPHNKVTVNITMPVVTGLSISGSGTMQVQQPLKANGLDLQISGSGEMKLASLTATNVTSDISGSGSITVSGDSIHTETDKVSGSGNLDFRNIHAAQVSADISGSGNAAVFATKNLDVFISGSGNVSYGGTPIVNSKISGSGSLTHF